MSKDYLKEARKLLEPDEFGQSTVVEVVIASLLQRIDELEANNTKFKDIINAICIKNPSDRILELEAKVKELEAGLVTRINERYEAELRVKELEAENASLRDDLNRLEAGKDW